MFGFRSWVTRRFTRFLTQPIGQYEQHYRTDVELLKRHMKKGDVLLVEGDQRVSSVIKYLTQSSWSHAAIYVGDELVKRGGALKALAVEHFGDEAEHLIVEALMDGVVASPLVKYAEHNVRLCRPHKLRGVHLRSLLDEAVASIGMRYDLRNILDLAGHLLIVALMPGRYRRDAIRFGSDYSGDVICTSLIGRLFHDVGFPVLPEVIFQDDAPGGFRGRLGRLDFLLRRRRRRAAIFRRRDPTLLTPRDFDLSPYFEVVKFNVIRGGGFDYARIEWEEGPEGEEPTPPPPRDPEDDRAASG